MKHPAAEYICDLCTGLAHSQPDTLPAGWTEAGHLHACNQCTASQAAWRLFTILCNLTRRPDTAAATWTQIGDLIDAIITGGQQNGDDHR